MKNIKLSNKFPKRPLSYLTSLILLTSSHVYGDVGKLLWEDNFNNLNPDAWHVDIGDGCDQGLCGWGNQELQWYGESNTYIADVPGESGNKALVLEARDEASNGYAFTSGKVESSNKVAVQYGMIEVRMQVPDVGIGLWPAAWMLGTTTQSWPAKGEIDMMEMGHKALGRAEAGHPDADINSYVGSNLIFYTDAACSSGNPTCAASTAWQTDNAHVSTSPLTNRFVTYRTYWTETSIRFTVEDNGVEVDMYDSPFNISEESNEFQAPFYLLLNLAVGGNFTDAATNNQVTAAKPAKMYIDYVRIYELDGQGEVFIGNQTVAEAGTFGVFTDNTPTNNKLVAGQSSDIYVWNQNSVTEGSLSADEGDNVIAWNYTSSNEWFGGGIQSRQVRDLSNFNDNGELSFRIKIPADVSFKIGIADTYTNQNWVEFPANTTAYGLVRNGDWATATIPAADIRGNLVALQSLEGVFNIASIDGQLPTGPFEMAIDDIVWTGGGDVIITDSDGDGVDDILDNCANTPTGATVDVNGCEVVVIVDTDNDGIIDDNDLCPNTATGVAVDSSGCTIIVAESRLIQAEDYTNFSDTTVNNIGGQYRSDAVDIEVTTDTDGGFNVGWIESGETLVYTLELGAGSYDISTRVASQTNGSYTLTLDGQSFGSDSVATGGWQVFQSHNLGNITLTSGDHTLRITASSGNFNINWINLALIDAGPIDADNDGVLDDVDQCLGTVAGVVVDEYGCEVIIPVDGDNDGVLDDVDQCLGTAAGVIVDGTGCEVVVLEKLGVTASSATNVEFFVNVNGWADVHYILNGGGQQNFRMTHNGSNNTRTLSGLSTGDAIEYSFTYQDDDGPVKRSPWSTYTFNGQSEQDSDSDGVVDSLDQCANTPANSIVDAAGCVVVIDNDNDAVDDAIDQCLNTPANTVVNEIGCAVVEEKFGISTTSADSVEFFVNVNGWADVHYILNGAGQQNFRMTQTESGNYKGLNGLNQGDVIEYSFTYQDDDGPVKRSPWSTYTFNGQSEQDSDSDGVVDSLDQCANTPANSIVDATGCVVVIDDDNDGVDDAIDQCLNTPANTIVNEIGCAVVEEKFGISTTSADSVEFFVNVNGWADVHYILNGAGQQNFRMTQTESGNYKDLNGLNQGDVIEYSFTYQDDDGSVKRSEWSTYTFAEIMVGDADNDGVNDDIDVCPATANGVTVDSVGCPIDNPGTDTDGDGVADVQDQCPGTTAGALVNALGCEVSTDVLEVTSANEILVGGAGSTNPGYSLYVFDNDLSANGSNCNDDCAAAWPPILVTDGVATGVGSLGTVTRNDGSLQATYNGRPLYFYANDTAARQTSGHGVGNVWWTVEYGTGNIVPLFSANTSLEQAISFDRGDALVTRFADRGRDRHAKEDHFQVYDHYLSHYWTHRTAQFEFVDYVAKGGSSIEVTFITEWKLGAREFRAWYRGLGTVAEYHGNYFGGGTVVELDNGRYDDNFNKISDIGEQYRYRVIVDDYRPLNWSASDGSLPLSIGQRMEIEVSQFLDAVPEGRNNYYGTTYLYIVGQGLVPWKTVGYFNDPSSEREDSYPVAAKGWLGGNTTLPYNYTAEPDNHFMQMATNLSNINGQPFVQGRRVHHTDFETGQHDERIANGVFDELAGKAGTHYVNTSCSNCHERNGRASVADVGLSLDKWVFKVAAANGQADPQIGSILQPNNVGIDPTLGEGTVSIASWTESNGLRSPNYSFSKGTPDLFSARLAPQLVGLGLLEAISETTILEREDVNDLNGDGISGKAQLSTDPVTGETRLGRFGYKAGASSVKHQVAGALNTDMGVMTSVKPTPDCGSAQTTCGNATGSELSDKHLDNLVKYIALLGVRPQRDLDDANVILGETKFNQAGCESCHRDNMQTSEFSQLSELRNQTIRPFTDLLLHDMGAGLADNLGEGEATGAEWRTTPLWGLGLSACVTGGVTNPTGHQGDEVCTPDANYLHDGRARTIEEAILWHGGEGENSRIAYENLSASDKSALLSFLKSL